MLTATQLEALAKKAPDGARMVSVGLNLCLYIEEPLDEIADAVLSAYAKFLDICPKEEMAWYLTNSMEKHEKVTNRTLGIPETWLRSAKKSKDLMSFEIKDSVSKFHSDTANWKFAFVSRSRDNRLFPKRANLIEFLFPCSYGEEYLETFYGFVESSCKRLPFLSGHAGYTLEVSKYYQNRGAYDAALGLGMRYRELDISEPEFAAIKKHHAIKGVNWLTILGREFAEKLPARERPKSTNLKFTDVTSGLIVQAGDQPDVADGNRKEAVPAYRASYQLVKRFIVAKPVPLEIDAEFDEQMERTVEWIHRFAKT